jgi:hypothetical protein
VSGVSAAAVPVSSRSRTNRLHRTPALSRGRPRQACPRHDDRQGLVFTVYARVRTKLQDLRPAVSQSTTSGPVRLGVRSAWSAVPLCATCPVASAVAHDDGEPFRGLCPAKPDSAKCTCSPSNERRSASSNSRHRLRAAAALYGIERRNEPLPIGFTHHDHDAAGGKRRLRPILALRALVDEQQHRGRIRA